MLERSIAEPEVFVTVQVPVDPDTAYEYVATTARATDWEERAMDAPWLDPRDGETGRRLVCPPELQAVRALIPATNR